jgi:hypothetical protein
LVDHFSFSLPPSFNRTSFAEDVTKYQSLVTVLVQKILSFYPHLEASYKQQDEETARGFCRIFAEAGESYVSLISQGMMKREKGRVFVVLFSLSLSFACFFF